MIEPLAIVTLRKARYFLAQAERSEADPTVLANRLPFAANLEAAIIYARSSIDHLRNEFAPKYNATGYRRWHHAKLKTLRDSDRVFQYFAERRDFIVHQEPEQTNALVSEKIEMSATSSISANVTVIRADGSIEREEPTTARPPDHRPPRAVSATSQVFLFGDKDWRAKSAITYVDEFIQVCEGFVSEAIKQFV